MYLLQWFWFMCLAVTHYTVQASVMASDSVLVACIDGASSRLCCRMVVLHDTSLHSTHFGNVLPSQSFLLILLLLQLSYSCLDFVRDYLGEPVPER